MDGVAALAIEDKMPAIEERKAQLAKDLETAEEPPPLLHPNMAKVYSRKINALYEALRSEEGRPAAADLLRTLIDRIELTPNAAGNLDIDLFGDLAGILSLSANKKRPPGYADGRSRSAGQSGCGGRI